MATQVSDTGSKTMVHAASGELATIAQRAQAFTNASGTAIALSEGSMEEIVCRARSGSTAPDIGASLRLEGTFTGLCIQTGKELRCDDAETDTRVDTAAIRALGIRSMVVIPIKEDGRVVGVLAVFAPTAHAFTITHVAVLRTIADQISASLHKERRLAVEEHPLQVSPPSPVKAASLPVMPSSVTIKPSAPRVRPGPPVISKAEPVTAVVAEEVVETAASIVAEPARKKEKPKEYKEPRQDFSPSFSTLDAAGAPRKNSGISGVFLAVAGTAVIVVAGVFGYHQLHKKPAPVEPVQESAGAPANVAASAGPQLSSPAPSPAAPGTLSISEPATKPEPATKSENARKPEKNSDESSTSLPSPPPKPERTVVLSTGASKLAAPRDSEPSQEAAPALSVGTAPGSLSSLATPVTVSTPSMLTQSQLQPIQVIKRVPPVYPPMAKQRLLSGTVVIQGTVGTDGKISNLQLVSGPTIFRDAAFDAVKQWQFKPATLNGRPIEQTTQMRFDFLPH
jgi:TonB family protein